jgi:hypothetical protein
MLGQFKEGDAVRLKPRIRKYTDIDSKYWRGIGEVSLDNILGKSVLRVERVIDRNYDQQVRFNDSISEYCYPAELFELVSPRQEEPITSEGIYPGDYIYIREAGGWGYSAKDNFAIAIVTDVDWHPEGLGRAFSGHLLKNGNRFTRIPEYSRSHRIIVTKATQDDFERCRTPMPGDFLRRDYSIAIKDTSGSIKMDLDPLPRKKKEKRVEVQSTRNLTV